MFDDLFCATALAAVGAVLAAGVWTSASELSIAGTAPGVAVKALAVSVAQPEFATPRTAMPIYDLPRVVVTGNRSRDGDMLAAELPERGHPDGR